MGCQYLTTLTFRTGFVGVRVLTPEEIVDANENGKKVIVQLGFYTVFTILLSVCALYRCGKFAKLHDTVTEYKNHGQQLGNLC